MGANQARYSEPERFLTHDSSDVSLSTGTACSIGIPEIPDGDADVSEVSSTAPPSAMLDNSRLPLSREMPPPPPPPNYNAENSSSSSPSPYLLNNGPPPRKPATNPAPHGRNSPHDLGYHTLITRAVEPHSHYPRLSPASRPWTCSSPANPGAPQRPATSSPSYIHMSSKPPPEITVRKTPPAPPTLTEGSTEVLLSGKGKRWAKNTPFARLPDDLVIKILAFLPSQQLAASARVCRRFYSLVWEPPLWTSINLTGDNLPVDKALKSITRCLCRASPPFCPGVERVLLNGCTRLTDRGLQVLARRCPDLRHLELRACAQVTNTGVLDLVSKCVSLIHLDVTGCSQVTCIDVAPPPPRPNDNMSAILGMSSCSSMACPRPQLFLQLQYLDLTDCVGLTDAGLQVVVRNCPHLACLYLRRCVNVTDTGVKHVSSYCPSLKELSLSDCVQVTDFGMYELARLGANLRYLSVAKCDQVSDAGIKQIGRHCYKLRYLNLRGCEAVSDDALQVLARSCSRLRALDIGKCDITDTGLGLLAQNCPNLKKLSVKSCELVTDEGIRSIAYYCRGLQQLNIQDCVVTIEGYRAVKKFCKRCIIEHTNPGFF